MLRLKSEILRRRQRRYFNLQTVSERRRHIVELFLLLIFLISVNVGALVYFEDMSVGDAAWLTVTTVTTVGYGDLVAESAGGRIATVLLLYIVGIFLLAQIAGEWIDYRFDRRDRMRRGLWRWKMKDHILIINTPEQNGEHYLRLLVEQIRVTPGLDEVPIQVFTPHFPEGLPPDVSNLNVVMRAGQPEGGVDLAEADIESAKYVILMAVSSQDPRSDSLNLDLLDQMRDLNVAGHVIVEAVLESNRNRFKRLGANAVIRPIRAYPELLVRTMTAPGTESILEDLFVYEGNHPRRYNVAFADKRWGDLASRLLQAGLGTPLGYLDEGDRMITNPPPEEQVSGQALFLMVSQNARLQPDKVAACIAASE